MLIYVPKLIPSAEAVGADLVGIGPHLLVVRYEIKTKLLRI
jgi:hypothetical protein